MIKKLQSLLFEDEDEEFEDDEIEEEEEIAVKPSRAETISPVKPAVKVEEPVQPVVKEEPVVKESHFNRIDVTQNIPTTNTEKPAPVSFPAEPKVEVKKPSIGITVDDDYTKPVVKQKPVEPQKTIKPAKPKTQKPAKVSSKPSYEFQPVISPIFGVDEKDMTALKNTTQKVNALSESEDDKNTTPVISPIYGSTTRNVVKPVLDTPVSAVTDSAPAVNGSAVVEDEIPEFSLDDILKVRDEEYQDNDNLDNTAPLFPDLTFPEEPEVSETVEEVVDQTLVMPKVSKRGK